MRASRATRRRAPRGRGRAGRRQRVMGVEVGRRASGSAARTVTRPRRLREHARPRARRLLPRARGDPLAALRALRRRAHPDRRRARADRDRRPAAHVRLHEPGRRREGERVEIPADMAAGREYREKLLDAVVETDEALMERYLDGQELTATRSRTRSRTQSPAARSSRSRCRRDEEPRSRAKVFVATASRDGEDLAAGDRFLESSHLFLGQLLAVRGSAPSARLDDRVGPLSGCSAAWSASSRGSPRASLALGARVRAHVGRRRQWGCRRT